MTGHVRRRGLWEEWYTAFETDQEHDIPIRLSRLVYDMASSFDQKDPVEGQLLGVYIDVWNGSIKELHEVFAQARLRARACNGSWVKVAQAEMRDALNKLRGSGLPPTGSIN